MEVGKTALEQGRTNSSKMESQEGIVKASYFVKTFGCQMNKHDSEVVAGLLGGEGLVPAASVEEASLIVFLTCCVRENADERLQGQVASLKNLKTAAREKPETQDAGHDEQGLHNARAHTPLIAVGGCIGQRDGNKLLESLPHVDIVFGTHNLASLPNLYRQAVAKRDAALSENSYVPWLPDASVELKDEADGFAADLPSTRVSPWHAWLPITQGCDNFCTYCIVPYVRGREVSRPLEDVVAQAQALVADGVLEITLLGQNVNSYGRDLEDNKSGEPLFAEVLSAVAATGVKRLGFATSHPKDLSQKTIEVMANTPSILNHLHLPVQSGSNRILSAMGRCYTREEYLDLVSRLRDANPGISLSTDIIVGFPGESEEDFEDTLSLAQDLVYDQMFTFLYSKREGTPAANMENEVAADVAQARFERLVECVQASARQRNEELLGSVQEVLIEGTSKRDDQMLTGRIHNAKVMHVPLPKQEGLSLDDFTGRILPVRVTEASTWFLRGEFENSMD